MTPWLFSSGDRLQVFHDLGKSGHSDMVALSIEASMEGSGRQ
jgi:hypothetical protein